MEDVERCKKDRAYESVLNDLFRCIYRFVFRELVDLFVTIISYTWGQVTLVQERQPSQLDSVLFGSVRPFFEPSQLKLMFKPSQAKPICRLVSQAWLDSISSSAQASLRPEGSQENPNMLGLSALIFLKSPTCWTLSRAHHVGLAGEPNLKKKKIRESRSLS